MVASSALSLSVGLVLVCSLANATQSRSAGVQGWLQVADTETATSETDIFVLTVFAQEHADDHIGVKIEGPLGK